MCIRGKLALLAALSAATWSCTSMDTASRGGAAPAAPARDAAAAPMPGWSPRQLGWGPDEAPYPGRMIVNPRDGAELGWVPPGEFMMGSTDAGPEEAPVHRVRLTRGFWMYRSPVTNAQYRRLHPDHKTGIYEGVSLDGDRYPVANVNWPAAQGYCQWAGMTLPTEAQWEYAARAGTRGRYFWGDRQQLAGRFANVADKAAQRVWPSWRIFDTDDGYAASSPVGRFEANPWGLYDMIGNVWQWTFDWYADRYYDVSPEKDPPGPASGQYRVIRGGSWDCHPEHSRVSYRNWLIGVDERFPWLGMRCASAAR